MSDQPRPPMPPPPNDPMFRSLDKTGPLEKAVRNDVNRAAAGGYCPPSCSSASPCLLGYCIFFDGQARQCAGNHRIAEPRPGQLGKPHPASSRKNWPPRPKTSWCSRSMPRRRNFLCCQAQQESEVRNIKAAVTQRPTRTPWLPSTERPKSIQSDVGEIKQNVSAVDTSVKRGGRGLSSWTSGPGWPGQDHRGAAQAAGAEHPQHQRHPGNSGFHPGIPLQPENFYRHGSRLLRVPVAQNRHHPGQGRVLRLKKTRKKDQRYDFRFSTMTKRCPKTRWPPTSPSIS